MITQEQALKIINKASHHQKVYESIHILDSLNRVLAQDIFADIDMPPFDKSAMDGYACREEDLGIPLNLIEIIAAGQVPQKTIRKAECSKIMTGAPIPDGADTVIMVEHTQIDEKGRIIFIKDKTAKNICFKGEDFKQGTILLSKGTLIKPVHIPIFATAGATKINVFKPLVIGVISTGNELVEPESLPQSGQIRNTNAYQIIAQAKEVGAETKYFGIANDTPEDTYEKIWQSTENCDITILSGGVSAGDFDFVPKTILDCGFEILFNSLAVQPGKPTLFAKKQEKYIFGLPGNPVSSFVQFELLVKPLIFNILNCVKEEVVIQAPLAAKYQRKRNDRKAWIPVFVNKAGEVEFINYHGSAHINAYINANAIMSVEIGVTEINKGDLVNVRFI